MTVTNPTIQNLSRWPNRAVWRTLKCIVTNGDVILSDAKQIYVNQLLSHYISVSEIRPEKYSEFTLQFIPGDSPMIVVCKGTTEPDDAMKQVTELAPKEFPRILKLLTYYRFMREDKQAQEIL